MITFIHGAMCTPASWNYLAPQITTDEHRISYSSDTAFADNLAVMSHWLTQQREPVTMIGHSLGGLYAWHLAALHPDLISRGITISTPYGGCSSADWLRWILPHNQLMKDIAQFSDPIVFARNSQVCCHWTNIVTISGSRPWIPGDNDGVVTVDSQCAIGDKMSLITVQDNHYEVLLNPAVANLINSLLEKP